MRPLRGCCQRASGFALVRSSRRPADRIATLLPSERRTFFHDPEPARKAYLERIHRGLGTDGHGTPLTVDPVSKTVSTAVGPLPISPLMDPAWLEATRRYRKEPKAKARRPEGRFRKKLARNAYALALATPVRKCGVTSTTVPRFFLQGMTLVKNPETKDTWWVPKDVAFRVVPGDGDDANCVIEEGSHESGEEADEVDSPGDEGQEARLSGDAVESEEPPSAEAALPDTNPSGIAPSEAGCGRSESSENPVPASPSKPTLAKPQSPLYSPTAWLLLRHSFLSSNRSKMPKIVLPNWAALSAKAVYREDMQDFVLKLRRRYVVDQLLYFARLNTESGRQALTGCPDWNAVQDYVFRGCVLWLDGMEDGGSDGGSNRNGNGNGNGNGLGAVSCDSHSGSPTVGSSTGPEGPGAFATMDIPGQQFSSKIPVHNLPYLLGDEFVASLREGSALFRDNRLLMLGRRRSIELQQALWQLQGFLLPAWTMESQK